MSFKDTYGPWAVVTGASSGIGREMAKGLAARDVNVVLVARRRGALEEVAAGLDGVETEIVAADLSSRSEVAATVEATAGLDVGLLVANAGFGTSGEFVTANVDTELNLLAVNVSAVAHMCHAYGRRLADRGSGGIVLLGSIVGFQGVPRQANYAASKAYVQSLAEGLGAELRPRGVDVLAVAPSMVESGFGQRADMRIGRALGPEVVAEAALDALGRRKVVRPGFSSKALGWSLAATPRRVRTRILAGVMKGFTKHQRD